MNVLFALVTLLLYATGALPSQYAIVDLACRVFTHAQNQANCGSCAAFAVATRWSMRQCLYHEQKMKANATVLSPHRLFDCTANATCRDGATIHDTLRALAHTPVIDVRDSPHQYGLPCPTAALPTPERLSLGLGGDRWRIRAALWLYGPLLADIDGHLKRGAGERVYRLCAECRRAMLHGAHAIVLVGWDADGNWLVQNSWGEQWGDAYGRGWVAPDVLMDAFDPSVEHTLRACMGLLLFALPASLCAWLRTRVLEALGLRRAQSLCSSGESTIQHSSDLAVKDSTMKASSTPSSSLSVSSSSSRSSPLLLRLRCCRFSALFRRIICTVSSAESRSPPNAADAAYVRCASAHV